MNYIQKIYTNRFILMFFFPEISDVYFLSELWNRLANCPGIVPPLCRHPSLSRAESFHNQHETAMKTSIPQARALFAF